MASHLTNEAFVLGTIGQLSYHLPEKRISTETFATVSRQATRRYGQPPRRWNTSCFYHHLYRRTKCQERLASLLWKRVYPRAANILATDPFTFRIRSMNPLMHMHVGPKFWSSRCYQWGHSGNPVWMHTSDLICAYEELQPSPLGDKMATKASLQKMRLISKLGSIISLVLRHRRCVFSGPDPRQFDR